MNHLDKQARREAQTSMVVKPAPLVPSVVNPRPDTLTVRDHFALAALSGLCSRWNMESLMQNPSGVIDQAYAIADAAMAKRKL